MRTCPTCAARYEAPAQYCQVDGAALIVDGPPTDPYLGRKILEQFRLERVVGSGGMGVVYEGLDEGLGRRVAVKILHRDLVTNKDIVQRFHREAQIAHQLDHPGIVRVILFGQLPDGNLYLVLEFLEGPTLLQALERDGLFAPARAVKVMCGIADAVGYTHARGIVHRDLKPENIILTRRGDDPEFPKVLDFGIAKTLIGSGSFVTQTGLIFGTARYISPEGASGEAVDQRGDVYSLAVMAYQLFTGHTPFESDEPMQLLLKHIHDAAPPMRKYRPDLAIPASLEDVVMRSLSKNPDARFDDGNAFARALREAAGAGGIDVRSIIPTAPMNAFAVAPVAITSQGDFPRRETAPPPERPSPIPAVSSQGHAIDSRPAVEARHAALPVSAVESSGVSRVRTVTLPTDHRGDARSSAPQIVVGGGAVASQSTPAPVHLPPRMEIPVITAPVESRPEVPPREDSVASVLASTRSTPAVDLGDPDEFPVIPRRSGAGRTFAIIAVSVIMTVVIAAGAAWAFRLFPSQRRADEIAALLRRSNDAFQLGRYMHSPTGEDVEDLTDAVLALDSRNTRAVQLRRNAATRLKAASDTERLAGHPERALPILQDALRLLDDPLIRDEIAATQREIDAQHAPPTTPTRPPRPPVTRPVARPAPHDPTLDHPAQPVVPLNPPIDPTTQPPVTQPPVTQTPATHPPRTRRDGGNVIQSPPDNMQITTPSNDPPVPVFGTPGQPDDTQGHTGEI